MKKKTIFFIFLISLAASLYGTTLDQLFNRIFSSQRYQYNFERLKESDVPMPETQFELPGALVGDFILSSSYANMEIMIYPNNKFILLFWVPGHFPSQYYGYVTKIDNHWYFASFNAASFSDSRRNFFHSLTVIFPNNSGFSFYHINEERYINSVRKEKLPVSGKIADITISARNEKQQYFYFNDSESDRIDFNEIVHLPAHFNQPKFFYFHQFRITGGMVEIYRTFYLEGDEKIVFEGAALFYGYIEITEENDDFKKGFINFTNGIPFYYKTNGTAQIEIYNDGGVKITMLYTHDILVRVEAPFQIQFPAKLVLEF